MIFYADETWSPLNANPFSKDGTYGKAWSAFIYDDSIDYYSNILENAKVYTLRVSPKIDASCERLKDFVSYEVSNNRNVIISATRSKREDIKTIINSISFEEAAAIRTSDPRWLVHSTTKELWTNIKKTGALLAPSELRKRRITVREIGLRALLEPDDYSDYIMLDIPDGCGEIVVNSRQLGYVCTDPDVPYQPGVRLYFDAHRIIRDGIAVRDGLHILKVKGKLPLETYLVRAVMEELLPDCAWTPSLYTEKANQYFLENVQEIQMKKPGLKQIQKS